MTYLFNANTSVINEVEIKNDANSALRVNVQNNNAVVSTSNPFPVTAVSIYNSSGNMDVTKDGFGRNRVSEPFTLFDSSFRYTDDSRNWDTSTSGSGAYAHITDNSLISMNVSSTSGDKVIRETKRVFKYQPGKSLLVLSTFAMNQPKTGLRQRVGYFGANNGYFIEQTDDNLYIVERSSTSGVAVDNRKLQSEWNVDKLDGTGASGVRVNVANTQIFWTDMEWLGVGSVRCGFVVDGQFLVSHIFHHANKMQTVYMTTASLPLRAEIENTSATSGSSQLKQICNSVMSEGGYHPSTATRAASTALTGVKISNVSFKPLVSIRLKAGREDAIVLPSLASAYGLQNTPFVWRLSMGGTISAGTWVSAGTESPIEYNITGTGISGDDVLLEGLLGGGTIGAPLSLNLLQFNSGYQLRRKIDKTPIALTLSVLATTNNDDCVGSLSWEEL